MADRVNQRQGSVATVRRGSLSPELVNLLSAVGDELDVYFEVTSGGQKERGPFTKKGVDYTGSTRHDNGQAADTKIYVLGDDGTKRYLDFTDAEDRKVFERVVQLGVAGGATGIGAGTGYMGNQTIHIGFGTGGTWGAGGKSANAPAWLVSAYDLGTKTPPMNIPQVASATSVGAIPVTASRQIDQKRIQFQNDLDNTPLPRPRPDVLEDLKQRAEGESLAQSAIRVGKIGGGITRYVVPLTPDGKVSNDQITDDAWMKQNVMAVDVPEGMSLAKTITGMLASRAQGGPVNSRGAIGAALRNDASKPQPAVSGDVLADLRDRVAGIVGKDVTPKLLTTSDGTPHGLIDPRPEMGPGTLNLGADQGLGSLVGPNSIPPAMLNPGQVNPPASPTFQPGMMDRGQPVEAPPVQAFQTGMLGRGQPQAPVEAPPVPLPREARPQTTAPVVPAAPQGPQIALTKEGKQIEVGKPYTIGENVYTGRVGPDGVGYLEKVPKSIFGEAGKGTIVGGMVESGMADAIGAAVDDVGAQVTQAAPAVLQGAQDAAGGLVDAVGGFFGDLFGGKPSVATQAPVVPSANANLTSARSEQATQRRPTTVAPVSANSNVNQARAEQTIQRTSAPSRDPMGAPLSVRLTAPTQGLSAAERNAIAAYSPKPATTAPVMTSVPVKSTVPNPAYADWVAKYGQDGSQIQTAPTGGLVTAAQLAAIQNTSGAVQKPIVKPVAPPPPPPKTITVTTQKMVPINPAAPATLLKNKTTAPEVRSGSGTTSWGQSKTASDGTSWAANW